MAGGAAPKGAAAPGGGAAESSPAGSAKRAARLTARVAALTAEPGSRPAPARKPAAPSRPATAPSGSRDAAAKPSPAKKQPAKPVLAASPSSLAKPAPFTYNTGAGNRDPPRTARHERTPGPGEYSPLLPITISANVKVAFGAAPVARPSPPRPTTAPAQSAPPLPHWRIAGPRFPKGSRALRVSEAGRLLPGPLPEKPGPGAYPLPSSLESAPSFRIGARRITSIAQGVAEKQAIPGPGSYRDAVTHFKAKVADVRFGAASRDQPVPLSPANARV